MAKPPRSILRMIYQNFVASFKPRQINGNLMGEDYFGNKYYEIPADPAIGKRKPSRYFTPVDADDFEQERTAEWDAWLRYRRDDPPTKEELLKNLAIMEMKKVNADKLDAKYAKPVDPTQLQPDKDPKIVTGMSFPTYPEYERVPGKKPPNEQ